MVGGSEQRGSEVERERGSVDCAPRAGKEVEERGARAWGKERGARPQSGELNRRPWPAFIATIGRFVEKNISPATMAKLQLADRTRQRGSGAEEVNLRDLFATNVGVLHVHEEEDNIAQGRCCTGVNVGIFG